MCRTMSRKIKKRNYYLSILLLAGLTKGKVVNATNIENNITSSATTNNFIIKSDTLVLMLGIILGILLFLTVFKILLKNKQNLQTNTDNGLTDQEIKKYNINLTSLELKEEAFALYKKLETAKTKQNYTTLKEILSEELYLEQEKKLKDLKANHQKLVATNIHLKNAKVLAIQKKKDKTNIIVYLHVSQYDYVIDKQKQIIRGTDQTDYQIEYKLTLEQLSDKNFIITKKECLGKWIKN